MRWLLAEVAVAAPLNSSRVEVDPELLPIYKPAKRNRGVCRYTTAMSEKQSVPLMGRLAIQLKMISMDQLRQATTLQGRDPERRLGDIFLELGFIGQDQLDKLNKVQRDLVIKHRAKQAASGRSVPARELPQARQAPADPGPSSRGAAPGGVRAPEIEPPGPAAPAETPAPPPASEAPPARSAPAAASMPAAAPPVASESPAAPEPSEPAAAAPAPQVVLHDQAESLDLSLTNAADSDRDRLHELLRNAVESGASDIHLHTQSPSKLRINGELQEVGSTPLQAEEVERMVSSALTPAENAELRRAGELDFCYDVNGIGRFRTNVYRQQRGFDAVFRAIPESPPTLEELGLPSALAKHTNYHQGMVLVTGPAACGKSSTMAALVNLINEEREEHILTIEDPIEYVHLSKKCLVNQRQVPASTPGALPGRCVEPCARTPTSS